MLNMKISSVGEMGFLRKLEQRKFPAVRSLCKYPVSWHIIYSQWFWICLVLSIFPRPPLPSFLPTTSPSPPPSSSFSSDVIQLGPWLAVEIPDLIEKGLVKHKENTETATEQ